MNRRKFIKIFAAFAGLAIIGGGSIYAVFKDSDPLAPFFKASKKALSDRLGYDLSATLMIKIKSAHEALRSEIPYIGGKQNLFTEWLNYGAFYLAIYQVLSNQGFSIDYVGKLIYDTYEIMADYPKWFLRTVAFFKYGNRYKEKLRTASLVSQKREHPGDFVMAFIEGDGEKFDYGLDITECGIYKLYKTQGAERLTRYMCLSDYMISNAFNRGLVRFNTIAEGSEKCDFRYKAGRDTYVYPLRNGWPPRFSDDDIQL